MPHHHLPPLPPFPLPAAAPSPETAQQMVQMAPHLHAALALAAQAMTISNPNPRVGCVIVSADGCVIGSGHTQPRGGAHAEIMALRDAAARGAAVAGSTVYVTLEPCAHYGRTPPCCDALVAARVARVVVVLPDPNPLVAGQGMARLQAAGVEVLCLSHQRTPETAPIVQAAWAMNIGFFSRMVRARPWVRLKTASSLDGITALPNGRSQWITSDAARADVQHWRARADAIVTGIGTVLADDPLLNARLPALPRQPLLVVLDTHLRTPLTARLWGVSGRAVWIATTAQPHNADWQHRKAALEAHGAQVIVLENNKGIRPVSFGDMDIQHIPHQLNPCSTRAPALAALLALLAQAEVNELHIEAGATVAGACLQQGLVDEMLAYIAPRLLGGGQPVAHMPELQNVDAAPRWRVRSVDTVGEDIRLRLTQGDFWDNPAAL